MSVWNIAHRGGAGLRPENTLAAFRNAIDLGADGAELDAQLSRDGHVVVFHDYMLNPSICRDSDGCWLSEPTPLIKDLTLEEMRGFDVGCSDPKSAYACAHPDLLTVDGEHITTLWEVVKVAESSPKPFRLFVELKTTESDPTLSASPEILAEACVSVLRRHAFLDNAIFVGFDWRGLRHVKRISPEAKCWFSTSTLGLAPFSLKDICAMGGEGWFPAFQNIDANAVAQAHTLGLKVGAWTVNDEAIMRALMGYGVDAICTDRPDILAALKTNGSSGFD